MASTSTRASLDGLIARIPALAGQRDTLLSAFALLSDTVSADGKIMACGNGGSAADAEHMVGELVKSFAFRRPIADDHRRRLTDLFQDEGATLAAHLEGAIPALSLVSPMALGTAVANDTGYEYGFAQQVYGLGRPGDTLVAISTSGNSRNVLQACRAARVRGVATVGLTGEHGGRLTDLCDVTIRVPASETHLVQELHLPVYHWLCFALEEFFFGQHGRR